MSKGKKAGVIVCIIFIALTLGFIWGNSLLSKESSGKGSSRVYKFILPILDLFFGKGNITHAVFRKLIHFIEFFILALEFSILFILLKGVKIKNLLYVLPICLVTACLDESLQILSSRGARVLDVLIDFSGSVFCCLIFLIIMLIANSKKQKTT